VLIQKLGLEPWVVFTGYVSDDELSKFYSACLFFVFPSIYEGFGLPVLEAMKCGAPSIIGKTSSLPEVAGDCAHYFDPTSLDSLLETFWAAYENPEKVQTLRAQGLERAEQFSWSEAAQKIHRMYDEIN
jgi:glycosyltransferase involved in cell wall biosynthesis